MRSGSEPTVYRTREEHSNHYTTDAVFFLFIGVYISITLDPINFQISNSNVDTIFFHIEFNSIYNVWISGGIKGFQDKMRKIRVKTITISRSLISTTRGLQNVMGG